MQGAMVTHVRSGCPPEIEAVFGGINDQPRLSHAGSLGAPLRAAVALEPPGRFGQDDRFGGRAAHVAVRPFAVIPGNRERHTRPGPPMQRQVQQVQRGDSVQFAPAPVQCPNRFAGSLSSN